MCFPAEPAPFQTVFQEVPIRGFQLQPLAAPNNKGNEEHMDI